MIEVLFIGFCCQSFLGLTAIYFLHKTEMREKKLKEELSTRDNEINLLSEALIEKEDIADERY